MIRLSNFFSDRMVLQRETDKNTVWGYGEGEICVSLIKEDASSEKVFEEKTAAQRKIPEYNCCTLQARVKIEKKTVQFYFIFLEHLK